MGKFKKTMKAIGSGLVVGLEAVAVTMDPQYWYDQAADSARRGRGEEALFYLQKGLELARNRRRY